MRLTSEDLRDSKIFMHFRTVKRWAAAMYGLTYYEIELMMSLHSKKRFYNTGFKDSCISMTWDRKRFQRLKRDGWIDVYRHYNKSKGEKTVYKVTRKTNDMVNRICRILLGEEQIPFTKRTPYHKNESYTDKSMQTAIQKMNDDYDDEDKPLY